MDNVIPVALLIALTIYLTATIPNFLSAGNLSDTSRQIGEFGLIVIGMTIVMLARRHRSERRLELRAGQSDRVGSDQCREVAGWRGDRGDIGVGALVGLVNGFLIGFLRLRAFLTTLVMLTLVRAIVELLLQRYSVQIATSDVESDVLGLCRLRIDSGRAVQLSSFWSSRRSIAQFVLTRLRIGWRIMAVGGSRRASYNAGIPVRQTVCLTYVVSGVLTALAGHALCGAAFRRRARHRPRPRAHGRDGGAPWRQQRRRRSRFGRQGADGRDHRLAPDERACQARTPERRVVDGGRPRFAACDRHRRALGQMATQSARQGLCVPGLSRPAAGAAASTPAPLRPMR